MDNKFFKKLKQFFCHHTSFESSYECRFMKNSMETIIKKQCLYCGKELKPTSADWDRYSRFEDENYSKWRKWLAENYIFDANKTFTINEIDGR